MFENEDAPLVKIVRENSVVILVDTDHRKGVNYEVVTSDVPDLKEQKVHLYLEHDIHEKIEISEFSQSDDSYAAMIRRARENGVLIDSYDDRSREISRDAKYPEESNYRYEHDAYLVKFQTELKEEKVRIEDTELVKNSPNPERMKEYLLDFFKNFKSDIEFRNQQMLHNLDAGMHANPTEHALIIMGSSHVWGPDGVAAMLAAKGYHVVTVQPQPDMDKPQATKNENTPDFILNSNSGDLIYYKDQKTGQLIEPESDKVSWKVSAGSSSKTPGTVEQFFADRHEALYAKHSDGMAMSSNEVQELAMLGKFHQVCELLKSDGTDTGVLDAMYVNLVNHFESQHTGADAAPVYQYQQQNSGLSSLENG